MNILKRGTGNQSANRKATIEYIQSFAIRIHRRAESDSDVGACPNGRPLGPDVPAGTSNQFVLKQVTSI
jgi:hypothetical protein